METGCQPCKGVPHERLLHTWYAREAQASWLQMHALPTQPMRLLVGGRLACVPSCQAAAPSTSHRPSPIIIHNSSQNNVGCGQRLNTCPTTMPLSARSPLDPACFSVVHCAPQLLPAATSQSKQGWFHPSHPNQDTKHAAAAAAQVCCSRRHRCCSHRMSDFLSTLAVQKRSNLPWSSKRCANLYPSRMIFLNSLQDSQAQQVQGNRPVSTVLLVKEAPRTHDKSAQCPCFSQHAHAEARPHVC